MNKYDLEYTLYTDLLKYNERLDVILATLAWGVKNKDNLNLQFDVEAMYNKLKYIMRNENE